MLKHIDQESGIYTVAVRTLCEFTAKAGDLDLRFTPSPTAQDGMAGHKLVAGRRGPGYETEISLAGEWKNLHIRGRADGYDTPANRLEEIKTYRGDLASMRANRRALHWAQAKVYGWLLCRKLDLAEMHVALVYFNVDTQEETVLSELLSAKVLQDFFETRCNRFLEWSASELAHRMARDTMLQDLRFPHAGFREGQRELAEAVYKTAVGGRRLLAQAPTGIGKTIGTLFPMLKAMPSQELDKLFFLAAKTPGRQLALDAIKQVVGLKSVSLSLPLRVIELVSREKSCEHPDKSCNGDSCPLAKGFYDRLPQARQHALDSGSTHREGLREVARLHGICPYYLTQEMTLWADVVVGDYNYYFDSSAMLHSMATGREWRTAILVDEAHNLVERARKMYSAELDPIKFAAARSLAPVPLKAPLSRLAKAWRDVHRKQAGPYFAYEEISKNLRLALQEACSSFMEYESAGDTNPLDAALMEFFFDLLHFSRLADQFGKHSLFDVSINVDRATLAIRNLVPGIFLRERFANASCAVLFSATLSPTQYYTELLGLPEDTVAIDVASPFRPGQLRVHVARHISTRYPDRRRSLAPIAELIAQQYRERPGNYLAFLSSYEYLEQVAEALKDQDRNIEIWRQSRSMNESARGEFLARFISGGRGIGFAVLGGSFAEGIDLPGDRLIGAFIATLGMPQINAVNEQMKDRMQSMFGAGYDYAYLYPGLQKIVQAAGRVIRTTEDEGVIHLMDDRFNNSQVRGLLPAWWHIA